MFGLVNELQIVIQRLINLVVSIQYRGLDKPDPISKARRQNQTLIRNIHRNAFSYNASALENILQNPNKIVSLGESLGVLLGRSHSLGHCKMATGQDQVSQ